MSEMSEYQRMKADQPAKIKGDPASVRPRYSPEVRKARAAEKTRRDQEARRRAYLVLSHRHEAEWTVLLASEKDGVAREKGPLPGDQT